MEAIFKKYSLLSERQKQEVEDFVDFLLQKAPKFSLKKKEKNKKEDLFKGWAGVLKGLKDENGELFTGVSLQHSINETLR